MWGNVFLNALFYTTFLNTLYNMLIIIQIKLERFVNPLVYLKSAIAIDSCPCDNCLCHVCALDGAVASGGAQSINTEEERFALWGPNLTLH